MKKSRQEYVDSDRPQALHGLATKAPLHSSSSLGDPREAVRVGCGAQ